LKSQGGYDKIIELAHKMKYRLEYGEAKCHFDHQTDYAGHDLNANVR